MLGPALWEKNADRTQKNVELSLISFFEIIISDYLNSCELNKVCMFSPWLCSWWYAGCMLTPALIVKGGGGGGGIKTTKLIQWSNKRISVNSRLIGIKHLNTFSGVVWPRLKRGRWEKSTLHSGGGRSIAPRGRERALIHSWCLPLRRRLKEGALKH